MNILVWLILGLISGWIAGEIWQDAGYGLVGNIIVGIVGSFIGGFVGQKLGLGGAQTGINLPSIITAVLGALLLLFVLSLF